MRSILLVLIQAALCVAIAISAFVLKAYGGDIYTNARTIYYMYLDSSIIMDDLANENPN